MAPRKLLPVPSGAVVSKPRLPTIPFVVADPPSTSQAAPGKVPVAPPTLERVVVARTPTGEPYEVENATVLTASGVESLVYATTQAWRCIDVFVDPANVSINPGNTIVSIGVYAVTRGMRVLVATGRAYAVAGAVRIAGARRFLAERWEVTIAIDGGINPYLGINAPSCDVTILATDNAPDFADDDVDGILPLHQPFGVLSGAQVDTGAGNITIPALLVGVQAVSNTASPRVICVDRGTASPRLVQWGLAAAGSTIFGTETKLMGAALGRTKRFRVSIFQAPSDGVTDPALGAAGNVMWEAYYR